MSRVGGPDAHDDGAILNQGDSSDYWSRKAREARSALEAATEALRLERAENDRLRREVAILSAKPKPCPAWNARGGDEYTCEAGPDGHFGPHRFAYETTESADE